ASALGGGGGLCGLRQLFRFRRPRPWSLARGGGGAAKAADPGLTPGFELRGLSAATRRERQSRERLEAARLKRLREASGRISRRQRAQRRRDRLLGRIRDPTLRFLQQRERG